MRWQPLAGFSMCWCVSRVRWSFLASPPCLAQDGFAPVLSPALRVRSCTSLEGSAVDFAILDHGYLNDLWALVPEAAGSLDSIGRSWAALEERKDW